MSVEMWELASVEPQRKVQRGCPHCGQDYDEPTPVEPPPFLLAALMRNAQQIIDGWSDATLTEPQDGKETP